MVVGGWGPTGGWMVTLLAVLPTGGSLVPARRVVRRAGRCWGSWVEELSEELVGLGLCERWQSPEMAEAVLREAPEASSHASAREAARVLSGHLRADAARRARHDAVVRLAAQRCKELGRVYVDTPLYKLPASANVSMVGGKSRRVDLAVEVAPSRVEYVEVTVVASRDLAPAVAEKHRKYRDLPSQPLVIAAHAVSGRIHEPSLQALRDFGFEPTVVDDFQADVRRAVVELAVAPLANLRPTHLQLPRNRRTPLRDRRKKKRRLDASLRASDNDLAAAHHEEEEAAADCDSSGRPQRKRYRRRRGIMRFE